jgi:hypothetical protein
MQPLYQTFLILTLVLLPIGSALPEAFGPSHPKTHQAGKVNAIDADPCWTPEGTRPTRSVARWRARMTRQTATHVVRHVQNACRIIGSADDANSQLKQLAPRLRPVLYDLRTRVLEPI